MSESSKYHNPDTAASDPGGVRLSRVRLHELWPRGFDVLRWIRRWPFNQREFEELLDEHLRLGDSRAAVVVSTRPLVVGAYTDEFDCVALLRFSGAVAAKHRLAIGARLLTVNTYVIGKALAPDIVRGPRSIDRWVNFFPLIADFLSDDAARIETRKRAIDDAEWSRCEAMGGALLATPGWRMRDGSPYRSSIPA